LFPQQTAAMRLTDLRLSVYSQLAACLQQCSHGDGDSPGEPWWVVLAVHLDITRQEQMDIGKFLYPDYHLIASDHNMIECDIVSGIHRSAKFQTPPSAVDLL